jgi:hypothetical protein
VLDLDLGLSPHRRLEVWDLRSCVDPVNGAAAGRVIEWRAP